MHHLTPPDRPRRPDWTNNGRRADATRSAPCATCGAAPTGELLRVLSIVRGQATGKPRCRHCQSPNVQRWGGFRGRQRYRCVTCQRTFSDFTATPLAHLKRPELWEDFCRCVVESVSVRRAADRLGIHKDTAFRWRHRLLATLREQGSEPLSGLVDVDTLHVRYSEKGSRTPSPTEPPPSPWLISSRDEIERQRVYAVLARDRAGVTVAEVVCRGWLSTTAIEAVLRPLLSEVDGLVSSAGPYSRFGVLCKRVGLAFHWASPRAGAGRKQVAEHKENTRGYLRRLRGWKRRFRGVATKYLNHYLRWHTWLEVSGVACSATAARRLLGEVTRATRSPAPALTSSAGIAA